MDAFDPSQVQSEAFDPSKVTGPPTPRGAIGEVGTALARGALVGLPEMAGMALQYASSPGNAVFDAGKAIRETASAYGELPGLTLHPEEHNVVTNALAAGAEMVPSIAAPVALGAGALAALPVSLPALAGTGLVAAGAAIPFAAQAGQATLEKGEKAGLPEDAAHTAARLNAGLTFATQAGLGLAGGQLLGRGAALFSSLVKSEGADLGAQALAQLTGRSGVVKPFVKQLPVTAGEAVAAGAVQAGGSAAIERAYGVDTQDPWDAAIQSIPAMLGLTAITAPFGLAARALRANSLAKRAEALENKDTAPQIRDQLAAQYFTELNKVDPEKAKQFAANAQLAIESGQELKVDHGLFQEGAVKQPPAPETVAPEEQRLLAGPGAQVPPAPTEVHGPSASDLAAAERDRTRAAEENRQALVQTHLQVLDELRAAGEKPAEMMPFSQFRDAMAAEAKKAGLKADDLKPDDYIDMYQQHQRDVMNENFGKAQALAFKIAGEGKPKSADVSAPKSALAVALGDAMKRQQVDQVYRDQQKVKEQQLDAMQTRQRAAEMASAAEGGKTSTDILTRMAAKTLPHKAEALVSELRAVKPDEQGMPPKLMKEVTGTLGGMKSLEDQLVALKKLRDAKNPQTASYELLDKLFTRLGGDDAITVEGTAKVDVRQPPGNGKALGGGNAKPPGVAGLQKEIAGAVQGSPEGEVKLGRTKGTTDDRHTIGPPNEVGELLPYTRTLSQAREGAGGIFGEKQWWQDLAWAVRHPETPIGKELLENGKVTNEQIGSAIARDERYQKADVLLEQMRVKREEALRERLLADAQPEKAKEILKAKDLQNIFGGEESDYEYNEKRGAANDDERIRGLFKDQPAVSAQDMLSKLQAISVVPEQKQLIAALQKLNLDTSISLSNRDVQREGQRVIGLQSQLLGHILLMRGGTDMSTVLHELVHAATVGRIDEAYALINSIDAGRVREGSLSAEQKRLVAAGRELTDLYLDALNSGADHYGLTDPKEFVAEALTNPEFQKFLEDRPAPGLWQRVLAFVRQVLGLRMGETALEKALSVSQQLMQEQTGQRVLPSAERVASLEHFMLGPKEAAAQTDDVLAKVSKLGDAALSIKQGFTKAHLYSTTLNHIRQVFKDVLPQAYRGALDDYGTAKDRTKMMVDEANRHMLERSREMAALGDKQPGLDTKLYRLMGESTRFGIFPDRELKDQPWKAKEATPEKLRKYNELRTLYEGNPALQEAYKKAAEANKAMYDAGHATVVRSIAYYSDVPRDLWKAIDASKGYSPEVKAVEQWLLTKGNDEQRTAMRGALAQFREQQQGPYFHLGRNGSYFTRFTIADTPAARAAYEKEFGVSSLTTDRVIAPEDRHIFARYETVGEWKAVTDKLNKLQSAGHLEPELQSGQLETMIGKLDSSSPAFVRGLLRNIEADTRLDPDQKAQAQDVLRRLAVEMLPETSASKAFAQRKGVAGYDVDMNRSFVKRGASMSYFIAHNSIRPEIEESMLQIKQGVKELQADPRFMTNKGLVAAALQDELKKRQANELLAVKTPMLDNVSALSHTFYLAANPAFFMMKTLQPWQLALPQLGARHGFVSSFKAMTKATATALGVIKDTIGEGWQRGEWRGLLDPDIVIDRSRANAQEKVFLKSLIAAGGVTFTQAHDMGAIAAGESQGISTTVKAGNASMHYSEALDRMTAGLAGFNLEMKRTGDMDKATQYGIQIVKNSLYDYNVHNKGRMFSKQGMFGTATPLLTQFAQYQIQTLEMMGRLTMDAFGKLSDDMTPVERTQAIAEKAEARRALAGLTATTLVLAGTMGLPAVTVLTAAYNALFGTRDEPADAQSDYRNFLADVFGKDAGEIIAHGALRAAGTDLGAGHLGFQDIVPFSRFLADRRKLQDRFDSGAMAMMGPAVGAVSGFAYGIQNMLQGRYMKGLEQMLPSGLKGVAKAVDLEEHGLTDLRGNKLPVDITGWDIFNQSLNATPAKVVEQKEAQRGVGTTAMLLKLRSSDLQENFAVAAERGDGEEMKRLTDQIVEFNKSNPDYAIRDLGGILRQRAIARVVAEQTNVEGRVKQLPRLQAESRFANVRGMP